MDRKTFTAQALVAGKLCDVSFNRADELLANADKGIGGDRMVIVISACRSTMPDARGGEPQEPFTADDAEHILHSLEVLPALKPTMRPSAPPVERRPGSHDSGD